MKSDDFITFPHFLDFLYIVEIFGKSRRCFCVNKSLSYLQLFWTSDLFCRFDRYLPERAMKKTASASLKNDAVRKESWKKGNPNNKLNSSNLKKLGELSLKETIQAAAGKTVMRSKQPWFSAPAWVEKSNAWNQHQNHLKKPENKSLKKDYESLDKKEKGLSTSLFLLKKNKVVFGVTYLRGPGQLPLLDITESTSTQWTASVHTQVRQGLLRYILYPCPNRMYPAKQNNFLRSCSHFEDILFQYRKTSDCVVNHMILDYANVWRHVTSRGVEEACYLIFGSVSKPCRKKEAWKSVTSGSAS